MPTSLPRILLGVLYQQAAEDYLRGLKMENLMEAMPQATQRKITLESLDLVSAQRPDVHVFNELLVQYERPDVDYPGQVVPDNMVVLHDGPLKVGGSYGLPFQPVRPFWVLEYVSKSNRRKDWSDNIIKYEQGLRVPYYLVFEPEIQELILHRHNGTRFITVLPNEHGRYPIPEMELELGLHEEWVRYWFRGELLPLPSDLLRDLRQARKQVTELRLQISDAEKRADDAAKRADDAEQKARDEQRMRESLEAQIALLQAHLKGPTAPPSGAP